MQLAVARCARCGLEWNDHVETAAHHMGRSLKVPAYDAQSLLEAWWAKSIKWAVDRPAWKERAAAADLALAEEALHILAGGEIPLDGGSSTRLNDQSRVTVELAARGLGEAGRVPVPPHVWGDWADPEFGKAGGRVNPLPPSRCPPVAALLSRLASQGLVNVVVGDANAEVFVKWKSERKCALIVNMEMFNRGCKYKARPFKLPSLEGLAVLLKDPGKGVVAGGGGCGEPNWT